MRIGKPILRHRDGSILDVNGKEIFLGLERFKSLVSDRGRCFLCGESEIGKPFNDEHVIPDWVQRSFGLRDKKIKLSNGTTFDYPKYKIKCCVECNTFLGKNFERPISEAFSQGPDFFMEWLHKESFRIFLWVNLIFLKIHLKDNELRLDRNLKSPDRKIGDLHDWTQLHHCHALVRATRLGFGIDMQTILGSLFCLKLGDWAQDHPYDYNDHLPSQTVMIRLGEVALICALNDSCGVFQGLAKKLENLPHQINPVQLLEILTEFQFVNIHIKDRPVYKTEIDTITGEVTILGQIPKNFELEELDFSIRGELMVRNIYGSIEGFTMSGLTVEETTKLIAQGDVTFMQIAEDSQSIC